MGHIIDAAPGDDRGPLINRVSLGMYTVALAVVALRLFTRGFIVKRFGLDDIFIAVAIILGAAQTVTILFQVENGRGRHANELHVEQMERMLMYSWINMLLYFVGNWTVKMSILALYHRIGSGKQGLPWTVQSRAVWMTASLITAFTLAVFLAQFFACTPISYTWNIETLPNSCISGAAFMRSSAAINIATDIVLLLFPLPLLPLLAFNNRQRTALALIFSIGLVPVIASTMRLCEIVMSGSPLSAGVSWQEADTTWTWAWVPVWSQIEVDMGILAASLPSLNPLFRQVFAGCSVKGSGYVASLPEWTDDGKDMEKETSTVYTAYYGDGSKSDSESEDEAGGAKEWRLELDFEKEGETFMNTTIR
ncbi:hypothetical protein P153DRAFT_88100 [Dothidotthia symphoricarpi CBS 119687]|uniref:Rhodopsin domain-containing protein n=1 Tax=Dothidotthia symphoricarpi CBS 119687 TaxID=1392245 RepID=A0A6A6A5M7_9PLEO|nr:uncharacterized protein P153DRAFT_88100 [Dothidotthia symphoricarpi CBS 119687]KAF2126217.1 hypothetical protein P153DRAFT_88100 [Dothidotthia symphoricarpi CBS 119687]